MAITSKRWRKQNLERERTRQRLKARELRFKKYGITETAYDAMFKAQGGLCAVCRSQPAVKSGHSRLHIDHDHKTGAVRGLLCYPCNLAIGRFKDCPENMRRAADYVESAGKLGCRMTAIAWAS